MVKLEDLATLAELKELGWKTVTDLKEMDIPDYMVYRWGPRLEEHGLASKLDLHTAGRGLWLVAPEAISFLQGRRNRPGRPADDEITWEVHDGVGTGKTNCDKVGRFVEAVLRTDRDCGEHPSPETEPQGH